MSYYKGDGSIKRIVLSTKTVVFLNILFFAILFGSTSSTLAAGWDIQTVDNNPGDVGWFASLALDSGGNPHIAYYDDTNRDLKFAFWDGSGWQIQTVDSADFTGSSTSLALDSNGSPHISYREWFTYKDLKYAFWNGSSWDIQTVDNVGDVGSDTSLALDSGDSPHISYYYNEGHDLRYAAWNGSSWDVQTVDSAGDVGSYSSLALNIENKPCISYYDFTYGNLKYACWNGSSWNIQTVDSAGIVGSYTSLALDTSGNPRISYYNDTSKDLKYASWSGSAWDVQTVDNNGDVGKHTSLVLDSAGNPHISYYNATNGALKYAFWDGIAWRKSTVDGTGGVSVGEYSSLALDARGRPRISYYDATNGNLKYAKWVQPDINVTPSAVDFGNVLVGSTYTLSVTVKNEGDSPLTIGTITNPGAPFSVSGITSGQTIAPGSSVDLTVRFSPTVAGSFTANFDINSDDPDENLVTVNLTGTGGWPDVSVAPLTVDFGDITIGITATRTVTLRNEGVIDLAVGIITAPGAPFSIEQNVSGENLAPGDSASFTVGFSPTVAGTFNTSFNIYSNDPDESPVTVNLAGQGIGPDMAPEILVTPLAVSFGEVPIGAGTSRNVTVGNDGSADLHIGAITDPGAPFSVSGVTYGQTVAPGSSADLTVRFSPTVAGSFTANFDINSDDPDENLVTVALSGSGITLPDLSGSFTLLKVKNKGVEGRFLVKNTGSAAAGNFKVAFYLSVDDRFNPVEDKFLLSLNIHGLKAGKSDNEHFKLKIHSFNYLYLLLVVDQSDQVGESDENNNVTVKQLVLNR